MGITEAQTCEEGLAKMFRDGASNIETRKVDARELESRELTAEEQAIIAARVAHQQKMFAAFQKQDLARKVAHVREVHEDISEAAASRALEECDGSEDAAAEALADSLFKHRVQVAVGDRVARPISQMPKTRTGSTPEVRPAVVDASALGGVFLGKFRGRGPLPVANVPPAAPLSQRAVTITRDGAAAPRRESSPAAAATSAGPPAAPSHSGHSSGSTASGSGGSDGSAGTSVRERTPEAAAAPAQTASLPLGGQAGASQPATPTRSGGDRQGPEHETISPPSHGWRSMASSAAAAAVAAARPAHAAAKAATSAEPAEAAAAAKAADAAAAAKPAEAAAAAAPAESAVRSPQTRRQLALQQLQEEEQQLQLALQRSAAEQQGTAAAPEASPAQPAVQPQSAAPAAADAVTACSAEPPADAAEAGTSAAPAGMPPDAAEGPASTQPPQQAATAMAALPSDEETISLVAMSDDDIDVGTTSALQGPVTRSGRSPLRTLPSPRRTGRPASKPAAKKPPPQRAALAAGGRRFGSGAISRNGGTVRGRVRQKSHKQAVLLQLGMLRAEPGWFNAGYIFPDSFASRVNFRSSVQLDQLVAHDCAIIGEGGMYWPAPTFRVVAADRPAEPLFAKSCTGCWTQVLKRINAEIEARRRAGEDLPPPPKTAIAGPEYFGLNQPEIEEQIESLDPDLLCDLYWVGKGDRAAVAASLPALPPPSCTARNGGGGGGNGASAADAKAAGPGRGRRKRRRGSDEDTDEEAGGNGVASKWSALSRNERYRTRCGAEGAAQLDAANPLPERVDPITLQPVVSPAISPYGHVMGAATWKAVLAEKGKCPFTGQPLAWHQCTMLTHANIERFRDRMRD